MSESGAAIPLIVNPVPLTDAAEMLTVDVVLFVSVTVWLLCVPTVTLPKTSLPGLTASRPLATPVPVSEKVAGVFVALLTTETVALKVPAALGEKTKLTGMLCPARTATGRVGVLKEKYWLEIVALLTVILALPVLVAVMVSVLLEPAVTLPKSSVAVLNDKVPPTGCVIADFELNPWQPTIIVRQTRTVPSLAQLPFMAPVPSRHFIGLSWKADSA